MRTLRFVRAGAVEIEVPLESRDLRVGRSGDNDVVLLDPDKTLSRHHAELRSEGDRWFYLDLNSANGSWIGDRRVTREELTPGLAVTLGDYELTVIQPAVAAVPVEAGDATRVLRSDDTLRPGMANPPRVTGARPAATPSVVGGAIASGAPAARAGAASSPSPIRRIIIYGSIAVFGAFAVMLAAMLRPEPEAPDAEEPEVASAPAAAPGAPPPSAPPPPAEPAPTAATPAPAPVPAPVTPPPVAAKAPEAPRTAARTTPAAPRPAAPRPAPRPRPPADTDVDAAAIPARDGEAAAALQQRRDDLRRRYAQGLQQLTAGRFAEARAALAAVAADAPRFRDVSVRLAEAEAGLRQQTAEDFKAAARLEQAAEWHEALAAYERLRPSAATLPGLTEAIDRTRTRMHAAGIEALTRARQFDSRGRVPEAIAWYQRAVNWLAPDHPGLESAKQRLAQLVNRP
jgi:predicted component of type VI protein secretion system